MYGLEPRAQLHNKQMQSEMNFSPTKQTVKEIYQTPSLWTCHWYGMVMSKSSRLEMVCTFSETAFVSQGGDSSIITVRHCPSACPVVVLDSNDSNRMESTGFLSCLVSACHMVIERPWNVQCPVNQSKAPHGTWEMRPEKMKQRINSSVWQYSDIDVETY